MTADPFLDRLAAATHLAGLPDLERQAVVEHTILGLTYREIGRAMGRSPERARQAHKRGLEMLRDSMERRAAA